MPNAYGELTDREAASLIELANSLTWQRTPESSNVAGLAYDAERRLMFVSFTPKGKPNAKGKHRRKRGAKISLYVYSDVPLNVYRRFRSASSKGSFVWSEIRNFGRDDRYSPEQLE